FGELQRGNAERPPGITHFGLHVDNMAAATAMFKARGAAVGETTVSGTKAILSNIADPNGIRAELAELPPEALHPQAMGRWREGRRGAGRGRASKPGPSGFPRASPAILGRRG